MAALRQFYDVQSDIPQHLSEFYQERDGKSWLMVEPAIEDISGLKNALNQERGLRRDAEKQLTDMKVKFEGIEPEEVIQLRDRVKGLDDHELYDRNGIEALVAKRTQTMKDEHTRVMSLKERENAQLKDLVATTDRRWRQDRIKMALLEAVEKAGVYEKAIADAVQRGFGVFTDLDDDGNVVARNGEDVRYGKDGVNPLTPSEWIQTVKASGDAPHLWPPSSGGGAPAHHNGTPGGVDYAAISSPTERLTAFRQAQRGTRG